MPKALAISLIPTGRELVEIGCRSGGEPEAWLSDPGRLRACGFFIFQERSLTNFLGGLYLRIACAADEVDEKTGARNFTGEGILPPRSKLAIIIVHFVSFNFCTNVPFLETADRIFRRSSHFFFCPGCSTSHVPLCIASRRESG